MKKTFLLVVASVLALAVIGCKGGDDAGSTGTGTGGAQMPVTPPANTNAPAGPKTSSGPPAVGQAPTVQLNTGAADKFTPGTQVKGGK